MIGARPYPAARPPATPRRRPRARRWLGRFLVAIGLLLIGAFAGDMGVGLYQENQLNRTWDSQRAALGRPPDGAPLRADAPDPLPRPAIDPRPVDGVDFAITVPKIGYHAAVQEGTDLKVLASGPGHYSELSWPGQPGNVGVAAHNVYWIRFDDLQAGDQVKLETRWGDYTYEVTGKTIVNPDDRTVLLKGGPQRLTLTTCWPLWAGAFAGQRLVIFTKQVDPAPTAS